MTRCGLAGMAMWASCLLFGSSGLAQETEQETAEEQPTAAEHEARSLFEAGRSAFTDGRFNEALAHFQRSYELSHRPELLFNIGVTLDRLRRDREALESFEAYLREVPDAANRAEIEGRIQVIQRNLGGGATNGEGTANGAAGDGRPGADTGGGGRLWTWVAGGAAVVFGGVSLGFWLAAGSSLSDLESTCGATGGCTQQEVDDSGGPMQDTLAGVFLGLSLASAAGAAVLFFVEGPEERDETTPVVGIGPGSVSLSGRF